MSLSKLTGSCKIIDLSKLFVSEFNARQQTQESTNSVAFKWLCDSIRSEGLIEPIVVRPIGARYEIVAGTRRYAALKEIGATEAPVVVREMSDNDVRVASLVENIHRLDLTEDEKEDTLKQIYLTTWNEWRPEDFALRDYSTDENKLKLARSYLNRIHNEETGAIINPNYPKVRINAKGQGEPQKVKPTEAFKKLSGRVGYSASTQIVILKGYGSLSSRTDFYEELPPTIKELVEQARKDAKLKEAEKQQLSRRHLTAYKTPRTPRKVPKTNKEKSKQIIDRFKKEKIRAEVKQEYKKKEQAKQQQQQQQRSYRPVKQPETQINAVRARDQILETGNKLFKLITGQEIQGTDPETNENFAKNIQAVETMKQLVTFISDSRDIAAQQQLVIPLNIALTKYRDLLYEAAESTRRKEDMGSR